MITEGGLIIMNEVNVVLRETSFLSNIATNTQGHEIYFRNNNNADVGTVTISSINTYFSNYRSMDNIMNNKIKNKIGYNVLLGVQDMLISIAEGQVTGKFATNTYSLDKAKQNLNVKNLVLLVVHLLQRRRKF